MKKECTISTPQFKDRKVNYYHTQSGVFDTETLWFTPNVGMFGQYIGGDHPVHFGSIGDFNEAVDRANGTSFIDKFKAFFKWL